MLVLFVVACAVAYFTVFGFSLARANLALENNCASCSSNYSCYSDHASIAFFISIAWPVGIPASAAYLRGRTTRADRQAMRDEQRRARELAEAKHEAELAKQQRIAAAELDRQLQALGK